MQDPLSIQGAQKEGVGAGVDNSFWTVPNNILEAD